MAMIINLELPKEDIERISEFMRSDCEGRVPELKDEDSVKVLDEITGGEGHPLWHAVIGRFVECENGDSLQGKGGGGPTGRHGRIEEDYENPEAAFVVGVPL
jgi:hypothetical protein